MPPCSEHVLKQMLGVFLQNEATNNPGAFPHPEIRPSRLSQLAERIRGLRGHPLLTEKEIIQAFLQQDLRSVPKACIGSSELFRAYLRHTKVTHQTAAPRRTFFRLAQALIRSLYSVGQSHDVVRGGKRVRGYRGLELRQPVVTVASGASDTTGGSQKPA